jgi:hypothetical protein
MKQETAKAKDQLFIEQVETKTTEDLLRLLESIAGHRHLNLVNAKYEELAEDDFCLGAVREELLNRFRFMSPKQI